MKIVEQYDVFVHGIKLDEKKTIKVFKIYAKSFFYYPSKEEIEEILKVWSKKKDLNINDVLCVHYATVEKIYTIYR